MITKRIKGEAKKLTQKLVKMKRKVPIFSDFLM